jgi:multiple sugar transport system substrate-binding protein
MPVSAPITLTRRAMLAGAIATVTAPALASRLDLQVLYTDPQLLKGVHEEIARRYMGAHPDVAIRLDVVADYSAALQRVLRDALTGQLPDVAFHGHNNIGLLAQQGLLSPLDDLIAAEGDWQARGYSERLNSIGRAGDRVFGLPFALSTMVVMYNIELVKAAGADPARLPTTWDELFDLARRLKASSGGIYIRIESPGSWGLNTFVQNFGGRVLTPDVRDIAFDGPEGLAAMRMLRTYGDVRGNVALTGAQARQAFGAGSLGILVDSSSGLRGYERAANGRFEIRATLLPKVSGVQSRVPPAGNSACIMTKDVARRKAAWDYIKFATGPEQQALLATETAFVPMNTQAIAREELLGAFYRNRPNDRVAAEILPALEGWPAFPGPHSLRIDRDILDQMDAVVRLQKTPEEALAEMARLTRAQLPR